MILEELHLYKDADVPGKEKELYPPLTCTRTETGLEKRLGTAWTSLNVETDSVQE